MNGKNTSWKSRIWRRFLVELILRRQLCINTNAINKVTMYGRPKRRPNGDVILKYRRKSPDVSPWMEWVPTESDMRSMRGRIPRT